MITLLMGNSRILLTVNEQGDWTYLYYPYPGQFQHLLGSQRGIRDADSGAFHWINASEWAVEQGYEENGHVGWSHAHREDLAVHTRDLVHPDRDLVLRGYAVSNEADRPRHLRLFHYQNMSIAESMYQDTCYWDADQHAVVHYKRDYYFQFWGDPPFDGFTCGEHTLKGLAGSHVDAEDGILDGNTISHGATDSVVQWNVDLAPGETREVWLFLLLAHSRRQINEMYQRIRRESVTYRVREAVAFWQAWWESKRRPFPKDVSPEARTLYYQSLAVLWNCWSAQGSIIASPDVSSLMPTGDTYNYNWWRDSAHVAMAMDRAGLYESAHAFLTFAARSQEEEGHFFHRHFPDGTPGATWHSPPFLQVDQTASVISAAWEHFGVHRDMEFLLEIWPMVRQAADFMVAFQDPETGLPYRSYDLWEEGKSIHTYSAAAVSQGLDDAEAISQQLGKSTGGWGAAAAAMRDAILDQLWDEGRGHFWKSVQPDDPTPDSSTLLTVACGVLEADDPRTKRLVETLRKALWSPTVGGMARYVGDHYRGEQNPWIICTLWLADVYRRMGRREEALELVDWCVRVATPTHLLAEQVRVEDGQPASVLPLVWSHSTFVDVLWALS